MKRQHLKLAFVSKLWQSVRRPRSLAAALRRERASAESLEARLCLSAVPFLPREFYPLNVTPRLLATGDFNGDGRPDVAAPIPSQNIVTILINQGTGTFVRAPFIPFTTPRAVATADFNGDGNVDLAVSGTDANGNNVVAVYFGNGNGTFSNTPVRYGLASSGIALSARDVNGDGIPDLVATTGRRLGIFINNGDGTFASPVYYNVGGNNQMADEPSFLQVADFNGDGLPDIATSLENSGSIGILLNNPAAPGTFGTAAVYHVPGNPLAMTSGDFNNDGRTDLAVISSGFQIRGISILLGNGDGTFGPAVTYNGPYFADAVAAADFSGDGNQDLVVGSFDGPLEFFAGNGDGTFAAPVNIPGALYVQDVQVTDLNGDGLPDLVVPSAGVKTYLNSGGISQGITSGATQQTIGAGAPRSYTFFATDGTRTTISLQGPGTATLDFSSSQLITLPTAPTGTPVPGRQLSAITTDGTTLASNLLISTSLRSQVVFAGSITTDAPIGVISAPTTNLTGPLSLPQGARQINLLSANGGSITIGDGGNGPVSLLLGQVSNETISSAVPISQLSVRQDAGMTLTAPSVGAFTVGRTLHDSTLTLTTPWAANVLDLANLNAMRGINNVVLASAGNIGAIAALEMTNDSIFAGVGPLAAGQVFPTAADFIATASIGSVRLGVPVLAPSMVNSVIAASTEGALTLGSIQTSNGGIPFGLAAHSIRTVSGTDRTHGQSFVLSNLNSPAAVTGQVAAKRLNLLDFMIQIV